MIEAAICCDPVSGMLDIVSKGRRPVLEDIAQSFAASALEAMTDLIEIEDNLIFASGALFAADTVETDEEKTE